MKNKVETFFQNIKSKFSSERGEALGESITAIGVMAGAAVILFIGPVMNMANRSDDISQTILQTEVTQFVNNVCTTGELTLEELSKFEEKISTKTRNGL